MNINLDIGERGNGYLILNNTYLEEEDYKEKNYISRLEKVSVVPLFTNRWQNKAKRNF